MTPFCLYHADAGVSELTSLLPQLGQEGLGPDAGLQCDNTLY